MEETKKIVQKKFEEGMLLMQRGREVHQLAVLMSGSVSAASGKVRFALQPGAVLGLFALQDESAMEYTALESGVLSIFRYEDPADFKTFLDQGEKYRQFLVNGTLKQIGQMNGAYTKGQEIDHELCEYVKEKYARYKELCGEIEVPVQENEKMDGIQDFEWEFGSAEELRDYFLELNTVSLELQRKVLGAGNTVTIHHIKDMSQMGRPLVKGLKKYLAAIEEKLALLCGDGQDNLFALYMELLKNGKTSKETIQELLKTMQDMIDYYGKVEQDIAGQMCIDIDASADKYQVLYDNIAGFYQTSTQSSVMDMVSQVEGDDEMDDISGMLEKLLEYSGLEEQDKEEFKSNLQGYIDMKDKASTEDGDRMTRKKLTDLFYKLYEAVFFKAEEEERDNAILRLFLNFGIVDETMFEKEHLDLFLSEDYEQDEEIPVQVLTIRQWLRSVYKGEREPSINEFDMDYQQYLREENKSRGPLSEEEIAIQQSTESKVKFEMKNFFILNNRLTNGQIRTFCPVLTEDDLGGNLQGQMMNQKKISDAIRKVLDVDFSVFYREVMYDDRDNGITNLMIHQEILPEVVLMPNAGVMGRMWQEISGKKRATPARFAFPILLKDDLDKQMLEIIGSFRWEICKREQGTRWNDITEPSLTSEFSDYIQFYKKNRELSDKAKERLGQLMTKSRNNYGKVFVANYVSWVDSESAGNVRIDKVSRNILGRYCPFSKDIRNKLLEQPMFADALGRYDRERKKHLKELNNRRAAIRNAHGEETPEFLGELDFYEM